ncbi:MAG: hypothetical protein Q4D90_02585 [bacterium]|nr:hypothetical protein [bacterium]
MERLIDSISGQSCEIFAISHHSRIKVGVATPEVEIYEHAVKVPTIGTNSIRYKRTYFSIVICPDPEMTAEMTENVLNDLKAFELSMWLPRKKDGVFVPFAIYGACAADISPEYWEFRITDQETVQKLLAL